MMTTIIDSPPGLTAYFDRPDSQNHVWAVWKGEKVVSWHIDYYLAECRSSRLHGKIEKIYNELSTNKVVQLELSGQAVHGFPTA